MSRVAYIGAAGGWKVAASVALGCGMLACTWTLGSSIYDMSSGTAAPRIVTASVKTAPSFAERFGPAIALSPAVAIKSGTQDTVQASVQIKSQDVKVQASAQIDGGAPGNVYAALINPKYALGAPAETFRRPVPMVVASASPNDVPVTASIPLPPQPPLRQAAVPQQVALPAALPATRPADLKLKSPGVYSHEMLVEKARTALLASASANKLTVFEKLFKPITPGALLAYASADGGLAGEVPEKAPEYSVLDRATAVYDISAKTVYMPDGSKLEAHSGLGSRLDDPDYAHERMRGVTPPHIYDLKPRETLFHGVAALRLTPVGGESAIHGRAGLLAHTYMLGPNGQSNGCVSFKDYDRFLQAYRNGDVKRLIVVAKM